MTEQFTPSKEEIAEFVAAATAERRDAAKRNKIASEARNRVRLDDDGSETLDPTPAEVPVGHERPPTLQEQIAQLLVQQPHNEDLMDDEEDFMVLTPYEYVFDPVLGKEITAQEFFDNQDQYEAAYRSATSGMSLDELREAVGVPDPSIEDNNSESVSNEVSEPSGEDPSGDALSSSP